MCKWSGTTTHSNFTSNSILSTKFCQRRLLLYLCHGEHICPSICRYRIRFHIMPFTCEYRTTWFCIHQTHKEKSRKKSGSKMWRYKPTSVFCLLNVVKYLLLWLFFVVCQFATSWKWENILEKSCTNSYCAVFFTVSTGFYFIKHNFEWIRPVCKSDTFQHVWIGWNFGILARIFSLFC